MKHALPPRPELGTRDGLSYALFVPPVEPRAGVVILRAAGIPPLSLPNVARNVVAHELGHVLGLAHNADPAMLMCGRPAPCRPALFRSETTVFFPLTESEQRELAKRFR